VIYIPSVFIAENEEDLGTLFKELLESQGYSVLALANNYKEATDQFGNLNEAPNLFILDHNMPRMDGINTSREILKKNPEARILYMSKDDKLKDQVDNNNKMGIILKPFLLSTFLDAVHYMMDEKQVNKGDNGNIILFKNE
jgi:DNA-binding response OmpR family regulator